MIQQDSSFARRKLDMTSGASMQDPSVNRASYDSVNMKLGRPQDPSDWESWSVKSYEISILTGMLQRGAQENLMVLSDEMFRQCAEASPGGPSSLCLVTCAPETTAGSNQSFAASHHHADDEQVDMDIRVYYGKNQLVNDIISERYSKIALYGFVFLMFTTCALFLAALGAIALFRRPKEDFKLYLLPFVMFATSCVYLLIEVQPRYAYAGRSPCSF